METAAAADQVVLLVEDEPTVRTSAARTLRKNGYRVIEAASAEDAISLCDGMPQQDIHLVVSDIVMPGANGPTLVGWLTERHPSLRALFMSGYCDDPTGQLAAIAPDARMLQKPFSAADLLREVRGALHT
jgi:DNA-binding NtrC family response regulator